MAYQLRDCDTYTLRDPGTFHWRQGGEKHVNDPVSIGNLQVNNWSNHLIKDDKKCIFLHFQEAGRNNSIDAFNKFQESTMESLRQCTLRGQLELIPSNKPVDLDEVESAAEIVKRFVTGFWVI